jgi:hypothetical protein
MLLKRGTIATRVDLSIRKVVVSLAWKCVIKDTKYQRPLLLISIVTVELEVHVKHCNTISLSPSCTQSMWLFVIMSILSTNLLLLSEFCSFLGFSQWMKRSHQFGLLFPNSTQSFLPSTLKHFSWSQAEYDFRVRISQWNRSLLSVLGRFGEMRCRKG